MKVISEYFHKLKYQSSIILTGLFIYSFLSFLQNQGLTSPLTISGALALVLAIMLILLLIIYHLIKEYYENLISQINKSHDLQAKNTKNHYESIIKNHQIIFEAVKSRQDINERILSHELVVKKEIVGTDFVTETPSPTIGR